MYIVYLVDCINFEHPKTQKYKSRITKNRKNRLRFINYLKETITGQLLSVDHLAIQDMDLFRVFYKLRIQIRSRVELQIERGDHFRKNQNRANPETQQTSRLTVLKFINK